MNNWNRIVSQSSRSLYFASQLLLLFAIIAFISNQVWMLFIFLSSWVILQMQHYYLKSAGRKLNVVTMKEKKRMKIEDKGEWVIFLQNRGLPILKADLICTFDDTVEPVHLPFHSGKHVVEMEIPFTIWNQDEKEISIPISAKKRGISKIRSLTIRIHHLFGNGYIDLLYEDSIQTQMLVYPKRTFVHISKEEQNLQGFQNVRSSLFFDSLHPIGLRDYTSGDPFQHIHWKATARKQALQTKVFAPIASRGWLLITNIADHYSITVNLEEIISQTAYLVDIATQENIPFSLAVNIKTFNRRPFYYLQEDEGREQRQKALELLAMLSKSSLTMPCTHMLNQLKHENLPSVIIFMGKQTYEVQTVLQFFTRHGSIVMEVDTVNDKGVLKQWTQKQLAV